MNRTVRPLRKPIWGGAFEYRWERLTPEERDCVQRVVDDLRKAPRLPGPHDYSDILKPVTPCWRRFVPGTNLSVLYRVSGSNLALRAIKRG